MSELVKNTMLEAFKQKASPTMFLSGFFRTPPANITRSKLVTIDVKRNDELIAIDVFRGTGGNLNLNKRFTTKKYEPPVYDEYSSITEDELLDRLPGMHEYESPEFMAVVLAKVTDDQAENHAKILRSIEKQASDVLFTGTVVLINNDTIDFKQKATHAFNAAVAWSAVDTAKPLDDIATAAELNRKDGKVTSDVVVMGEGAFQEFLATAQVKDQGAFRVIERISIQAPVMNTEGATFQGMISAGSYKFQLWTYPQFYRVPDGSGLPNEGDLVPYVPTDKVLVTSSKARFDLVYAGVPDIIRRVDPRLQAIGLSGVPANVATDFHPYTYLDDKINCVEAGTRSAPLCIPTQIDAYSVVTT